MQITADLRDTLPAVYRERFEKVTPMDPNAKAAQKIERAEAIASAWVFLNQDGRRLEERRVRRVWAALLQDAELSHHKLHWLRHTYSARLLANGYDIQYLSHQLGHHAPGFTLSTYGHLMKGQHDGLVDLRSSVTQVTQGSPSTPAAPAEETDESAPETTKPLAVQGVSRMGRE